MDVVYVKQATRDGDTFTPAWKVRVCGAQKRKCNGCKVYE